MPNPQWPAALPKHFPNGVQIEDEENVIRSDTDVGPAQLRKRFSATTRTYTVSGFALTNDQREVLDWFYNDVTDQGHRFDWVDPWHNAGTKTFRFKERPSYTPARWGRIPVFLADFVLEEPP